MKQEELEAIAKRWSDRAKNNEWAQILADPDSYVNQDNAYHKFANALYFELSKEKQCNMLDIGCGTCDLWKRIVDYCPENQLYGVDFAKGMVEIAKQRYPESHFFVEDAADLDNFLPRNMTFSAIFSRGVLVNHLGKEYFSKILNKAHAYNVGFVAFDYLNKDWFTPDKWKPDKPFFTSEEMVEMVQKTKFTERNISIHDITGREPIVVIR